MYKSALGGKRNIREFSRMFLLFIKKTFSCVRAFVDNVSIHMGACPSDCICNNFLTVGIIERTANLMTGLEVKDSAHAPVESTSRAENVSMLEP